MHFVGKNLSKYVAKTVSYGILLEEGSEFLLPVLCCQFYAASFCLTDSLVLFYATFVLQIEMFNGDCLACSLSTQLMENIGKEGCA